VEKVDAQASTGGSESSLVVEETTGQVVNAVENMQLVKDAGS
jgi:hypothetical protein